MMTTASRSLDDLVPLLTRTSADTADALIDSCRIRIMADPTGPFRAATGGTSGTQARGSRLHPTTQVLSRV